MLAHKFENWDEMRTYISNLVKRGECKVLPQVVQITEGANGKLIRGWSWTPCINEKGELRFE